MRGLAQIEGRLVLVLVFRIAAFSLMLTPADCNLITCELFRWSMENLRFLVQYTVLSPLFVFFSLHLAPKVLFLIWIICWATCAVQFEDDVIHCYFLPFDLSSCYQNEKMRWTHLMKGKDVIRDFIVALGQDL